VNVVWTRRAFQRLLEIDEFIAKDNPKAAQLHTDRLLSETDKLGLFPKMGRRLPEIPGSDLRELVIRNYRVVYRVYHETIQILTVFESHKLLPEQDFSQSD
jgi:addiction module RelE/StbE family toxin